MTVPDGDTPWPAADRSAGGPALAAAVPAAVVPAAVVAAAANEVIGAAGELPWYLPEDLRRFRGLTRGHVVVMGRVTYDSILARLGRPLPDRVSVVISHTPHPGQARSADQAPSAAQPGATQVRYQPSVSAALADAAGLAAVAGDPEFFVIGGASVFEQVLPGVRRVYLTRIHQDVEGDRFMPPGWLDGFELSGSQAGADGAAGLPYSFLDYERAAP